VLIAPLLWGGREDNTAAAHYAVRMFSFLKVVALFRARCPFEYMLQKNSPATNYENKGTQEKGEDRERGQSSSPSKFRTMDDSLGKS